jgi:hypothetical protein
MQAFTDLVGTSAAPALSINIDELTELTPALDMTTAAHDITEYASEAANTWGIASPFGHCLSGRA